MRVLTESPPAHRLKANSQIWLMINIVIIFIKSCIIKSKKLILMTIKMPKTK